MILDSLIKVKNYKCFGDIPQGFDKIYPINILIGKNNSGKSSLIDLIRYAIDRNDEFIGSIRDNKITEVSIAHTLTQSDITNILPNLNVDMQPGKDIIASIVNTRLDILISKNTRKIIKRSKSIEYQIPDANIVTRNLPFLGKNFRSITAERDVLPDSVRNEIKLLNNGAGATSVIQTILTNTNYEARLINRLLLKELNAILNPEIKFTDIITKSNDRNVWEVYFEDGDNGFIPLSKMGSGVKTVLLVLLNLLVIPIVEFKEKSSYVFAFEELENNLHPALLRRLFSYIRNYCEINKSYYFITTHSNIVIDLFGGYDNAQIIHVANDGKESICTQVSTFLDNKKILKDLDVRASDILQSNGIIWVEGPSDRIYLNKWLSLINPELKEGVHYSIMFYGGKLLANLSLEGDNWFEKELIPLLKINTNAFVLIDRDGDTESSTINETKKRIKSEVGEGNCWITQGREVENYLTNSTLNKWLSQSYTFPINAEYNANIKLEDNILAIDERIGLNYNKNKKGHSIEIIDCISDEDLNILDLKEKLELLVKHIKGWNSL